MTTRIATSCRDSCRLHARAAGLVYVALVAQEPPYLHASSLASRLPGRLIRLAALCGEGRVVAAVEVDPAGDHAGVKDRPAASACRAALVVPVPREVHPRFAVLLAEPAVHLAIDRDEPEVAEAVLAEREVRRARSNASWSQSSISTIRHVPTNGPASLIPCDRSRPSAATRIAKSRTSRFFAILRDSRPSLLPDLVDRGSPPSRGTNISGLSEAGKLGLKTAKSNPLSQLAQDRGRP